MLHDLRNPVSAIRMATELLVGPLSSVQDKLEPRMALSVERTLSALRSSVEQVVHLVQIEGKQPRRDLRLVASPPHPQEATPQAPVPAAPELRRPARARVDVMALLRKLEIVIVTRSALPALLAVQCDEALWLDLQGAELMRALSNLVENAIEASSQAAPKASPWTVHISCERDSKGNCLFRIRNRGESPPAQVLEWLAQDRHQPGQGPRSSKKDGQVHGLGLVSVRGVLEAQGGGLRASHREGETEFCAWLPPACVHLEAQSPGQAA